MDDPQLLRYSRQILLPQIGIEGQQRLLAARVLIIGVGGLGSPVAMYLAASGVGHLVLVDHDRVELTNLQRQPIHNTNTLGLLKVESAKLAIAALNPEVRISAIDRKLDEHELVAEVKAADAVVDCSDNLLTRFAVNRACVIAKKPLVSGAVVRFEGQVSVFRAELPDSPCYACLYRDTGSEDGDVCSQFGVLAPAAGMIGTIQAVETLKLLLDTGSTLTGRVLMVDALNMEFRKLTLRKDPGCPVCGPTN
jgi:adenylyltransferase/sulfurtransferase